MSPTFPLLAVPRWLVMWCLAVSIYAVLKWWSWRNRRILIAPTGRHLGYLLAWPGMDADAFLDVRCTARRPSNVEWLFAGGKLLTGVMVVAFVPRLIATSPLIAGWIGMVGIVFAVHFGLFHLLSCAWRSVGVCAVPIMNWPILSESVAEFWGKRWNLAFRDLSHRFVFRPLTPRVGATWAMLTGFFVSGVVHDLVITIPAGGGYGGPTAYFALQGLAVWCERSRSGRALGLGRGVIGRAFAAAVLIAPLMLLFPSPFVCDVIVPFLDAVRQASA
jgi:hypothetical protein